MSVLITGAAGYIGSHVVKRLLTAGESLILLDDFSKGHEAALRGHSCYDVNIRYIGQLEQVFKENDVSAVIHLAALSDVNQSCQWPFPYYTANVLGSINLIHCCLDYGVKNVVFSSSASVYGIAGSIPLTEEYPIHPSNPYGRTKFAVEELLRSCSEAGQLAHVSFRYFNAAGADPDGELGEDHRPETHLIPLAIRAASQGDEITINGTDYPTPDGTCVRDYLHVQDIADAHILALNYLRSGQESATLNLGTAVGHSVLQVLSAVQECTGKEVRRNTGPRRSGDPVSLIAHPGRAERVLNWKPQFPELRQMVDHAWKWYQRFPGGYKEPPSPVAQN